MDSHNQYPTELSKKYERRAKVAAIITGLGIPALAGGISAKAAEASSSQANSAKAERVANSEKQTLKTYQQHVLKLKKEVMSAPGVKKVKGAPSHNFGTKGRPTEVYYLITPNAKNHKHHDVIGLTMAKGEKFPLFVGMVVDNEAYTKYLHAKPGAYKGSRAEYYNLAPVDGQGAFNMHELDMVTIDSANPNGKGIFRVGLRPFGDPENQGVIQYLEHPAAVKGEYQKFFSSADSIIRASK